jgi:hypothetical protein
MPKGHSFFEKAEFYIIKIVLIATTAVVGIAFFIFAIIHAYKFLIAAMH